MADRVAEKWGLTTLASRVRARGRREGRADPRRAAPDAGTPRGGGDFGPAGARRGRRGRAETPQTSYAPRRRILVAGDDHAGISPSEPLSPRRVPCRAAVWQTAFAAA